MRRRFKREERSRIANISLPEISLTPLIDTAFTLLIIFMVTTPMMQTTIKVALPETKETSDKEKLAENIIVSIDEKGKLFIDDRTVTREQLATQLAARVQQTGAKTVIVRGDKSLRYAQIMQVIAMINTIKEVQYVALATEQDRD